MALKSTIYRCELQVSDLDRGYYGQHSLTVARHPSETEERMMLRILAFALFADEALRFGKGLSTADEPDLCLIEPDGRLSLWLRLGLPDGRELRQSCGKAERVVVLAYGGRTVDVWWQGVEETARRLARLQVLEIPAADSAALAALAQRNMTLQVTVQDGLLWVCAEGAEPLQIQPLLRQDLQAG